MTTKQIFTSLAVLAIGFCASSLVLAQSKPAPWAATVKASVNKGADQGLDIVTYTYKFTNVSGMPLISKIKLGYQCDFFNFPLRRAPVLAYSDVPELINDYPRSAYDCVIHFGKALPNNSLRSADLIWGEVYIKRDFSIVDEGEISREENLNTPLPAVRVLNPKGYQTTNGWLASTENAIVEFGPGSSYYEIVLAPAPDWFPANKRMHVPAGGSFEFSVNVRNKDPNWTRINYVVKTRNDGLEMGAPGTFPIPTSERAYPITKAETTPPVITAKLDILPAKTGDSKDFVRVQLTASAKDNFDAGPEWSVSSVLRTDKPTAAGDVSRLADMSEFQWFLKVPAGEKRTYSINVRAEDATGNVSTKAVPITIKGATLAKPKKTTLCTLFGLWCTSVVAPAQ